MFQVTLKGARVSAGHSQKSVCKALKISNTTLTNWEKGRTFPTQPQIEALCELYNLPYDAIKFDAIKFAESE